MRQLTIATGILIAIASPVHAASCSAKAATVDVVEHVAWRRTPSSTNLTKLFPVMTEFRDEGRVRTDCVLAASGRLRDCRVIENATPTLDAIALQAMVYFLLDMRASCAHAGEHVIVPINFKND